MNCNTTHYRANSSSVPGDPTDLGFPGSGIWPATLAGVALLLVLLRGRSFGRALGLGFVTGVSFYLANVAWASEYLGPVPWLALSIVEALFFALGAGAIALAHSVIVRWWPARWARLVVVPTAVGGLWVARETVAGSWPYGGFAWGRIAYSQSESPFGHLVAWVGVAGLSFLLVAAIAFVLQLRLVRPSRRWSTAMVAAAIALGLAAVPAWQPEAVGELRVAAVQGDGPAGYFDPRGPGELLAAQVQATAPIVGQDVDVVLWPENSMDEDPLISTRTANQLSTVASIVGAPVIVGAVTERDGLLYNSSIVWTTEGPTELYDKNHPVPFGEYVPDRAFWSLFAPDLIGLVQRDYELGTRSPAVPVAGTIAGISICFDVVDDRLFDEMTDEGVQVIFAQTNNADFGQTDESAQQLAIARIRAMQTGRAVVNVSTVGHSETILPDGRTSVQIPAFRPGALVDTVPLVDGATPATTFRTALGGIIAVFAAAPLLAGAALALAAAGDRWALRRRARAV